MILPVNIVLAGVGGQGTLVAGKLLGTIANMLGLDVKVSEVHGMSQRGGSVITYVRIGEKIFSPVIEPGTADFMVAFEELEALRWAHLLRVGGTLLVNTQRSPPMPVAMGQVAYPDQIVAELKAKAGDQAAVIAFDAAKIAQEAGSNRAVNVVMVGALSRFLDLPERTIDQAIDAIFAEKFRTVNHTAFHAGSAIMNKE